MPKICYVPKKFRAATLKVIGLANEIIDIYKAQGFVLTLRQLYYQFVARDWIPNIPTQYDRLGYIVNNARLAGLIDWDAIEDRTRNLESLSHWEDPASIISAAADSFLLNKWLNQQYRVEVWIEKEALAGIFEGVCEELDVPYLSCRGYNSQSEMWRAAYHRLNLYYRHNQKIVILNFADHDPSGVDMTRDIIDRLGIFGCYPEVKRLALNLDQIDELNLPPNPAKITDPRFKKYLIEYGEESWELDALEPAVLSGLVKDAIGDLIDWDVWNKTVEKEKQDREFLSEVSDRWDDVTTYLTGE